MHRHRSLPCTQELDEHDAHTSIPGVGRVDLHTPECNWGLLVFLRRVSLHEDLRELALQCKDRTQPPAVSTSTRSLAQTQYIWRPPWTRTLSSLTAAHSASVNFRVSAFWGSSSSFLGSSVFCSSWGAVPASAPRPQRARLDEITCQNVRGPRCRLLGAGVSGTGTAAATSGAVVVAVVASGAGDESDMVVENKLRAGTGSELRGT